MTYTTVEIFCADPSHETWLVERFAQMGPADWLPDPEWRLRRGHAGHQRIDATRGTAITSASGVKANTQIRYRYRLICDKCGDECTIRAEKLDKILDRLAEHGVSRISLALLGAKVTS
jgi:hypothetical protein